MYVMNVDAIHSNGEPKIQIGMTKNKGFIVEYDKTMEYVKFVDAATGSTLPVLAPASKLFTFAGVYETFNNLTSAVTTGSITPAAGDAYLIRSAGGTDGSGTNIFANDIVAYGKDSKWYVVDYMSSGGGVYE